MSLQVVFYNDLTGFLNSFFNEGTIQFLQYSYNKQRSIFGNQPFYKISSKLLFLYLQFHRGKNLIVNMTLLKI